MKIGETAHEAENDGRDPTIFRKEQPLLEEPAHAEFSFGGLIGKRIIANQANCLLTASASNPAMIEMFRNRDSEVRTPRD